ncbi:MULTISPECIES: carbohydrate ABC transporter permease [unclassified Butyrivibrio]|jgi:multiple sugar transport system permease protein/putative aldouronate transport system permease protein|uniref:carbohydrate ABC transporter permease n=1 Tax=unclassified Butyrivibrio TaxID=2639466 RepID=UPI000426FD44|nr:MULTISPECIES: carbohydrate ABC transporter permease [unclassified Butyrivibrio]SCY27226.1 multiple sugar transport system permease protein [Butyrivibrio sp. INlla14]
MILRKDLEIPKVVTEKRAMKKEIEQKTKIKVSAGDRTLEIICYIVFTIAAFLCLYPFYYIVINTISANDLSAKGDILFWPQGIHFHNYLSAFRIDGLFQALKISLLRTVLGTGFTVFASAYLGFMFTQEKMWLRKVWYRLIVATMYFNAGIIPWYLVMKSMHLTNNFWGYILPAIVSPFNLILTKTFVESVPKELQEAAEMDGAGVLTVFFRVIIPVIKPIMATVAIFSAVNQWNAFQDTLLLMTDTKLYPLQFVLYQYLNQASSLASLAQSNTSTSSLAAAAATTQTTTSVRMTITVIVVLPIMLVYPIFQKYFVKGIMIGAVKG